MNLSRPYAFIKSKRTPTAKVFCTGLLIGSVTMVSADTSGIENREQTKTENAPSDANSGTKTEHVRVINPPKRQTRSVTHEKITLGIGSYFSHGDYKSDKATDVLSIPLRLSYHRNAWSIHAQIPYLNISGPENVLVLREGGEPLMESSERDTRRDGLGDLRLTTQYILPWKPFPKTSLNLGGGVKFPTADDGENLGTGEIDYHLFTGGYIRSGRWILDAKVGHQWMGDTPDTNYNNRPFFSIGGRHLISRSQSISLHYRHKEASSEFSEAVRSLSTSFHQKLNYGWSLSVTAGMGFGESSADYFGGFQISKSFIRKKRR